MALRFAILGLLAEQPLHGYAIQAALEERFGELCEPSPGEVYRALATLERVGAIARASARVGRRPERKVYSPTVQGRAALATWLAGAEPSRGRARADAFWLRLLVAERCAPQLLETLVAGEAQREHVALAEHEALRAEMRRPATFTSVVLALRLECDLRIARARLDALALCERILARRGGGAAPRSLLREIAESRRSTG